MLSRAWTLIWMYIINKGISRKPFSLSEGKEVRNTVIQRVTAIQKLFFHPFLSPCNSYLADKCHRSFLSADQSLLHSLWCPSLFSMLKMVTLSSLGLILYKHSQYSLCPLKCSAVEMSWVALYLVPFLYVV